VLSGGTGTPKLLQGISRIIPPERLDIVANTADDLVVGDIYICPDIDSVLYTLAGIIDEENWYGISGDTYRVYNDRRKRGIDDLLRVGDRDRKNASYRTSKLDEGFSLSEAVQSQCRKLGIKQSVWPMTDCKVTTRIQTPDGVKDFQEFWVRDGGRDAIRGIEFEGIEDAQISPPARRALQEADLVIIGPSNPVTSIGPIIKLPGVRDILASKKVVAVSPIRQNSPFSGPAGKMLRALGYEVSPAAVARLYRDFLDVLIIDESDAGLRDEIEGTYGIEVLTAKISMKSMDDKFKLAQAALAAGTKGARNGRRGSRGGESDHRGQAGPDTRTAGSDTD